MLDKETASYIWYCIRCQNGYAEDFSEWCYTLSLDFEDVELFEIMVYEMIESLPEKQREPT